MKTKKISRTIEMGMLLALLALATVSCGNNSNAGQNNDMAGEQTGVGNDNQTGNQNGVLNDNQAGNQNGVVNDNQTENQAGNPNGNQTGNQTGNPAGNSTGNQTGNPAGNQTGNPNGKQKKNQTANPNRSQTTNQPNNQGNTTAGAMTNGTGNHNGLGDLTTGTEDIEDVYAEIERNNKNATKEDWNNWVGTIVKLEGENADYKRLQKYKGNMSKEMQSFVELMAVEQTRPSFNEEGIQLTLGEMLDRCIAIENHIRMYGKGDTYQVLYPKYRQLMRMAVTGGYDGIDVVSNQYLTEDKQHIQKNALEEYKRVIKSYPNTETADILEEYLEELKENGNIVNQRIERFYEEIDQEIDDEFELTLTFFEVQSL